MAAASFSPEIMAKIKEVTAMTYKEQGIFYLNAFWTDAQPAEAEAETVWELVHAFQKEDHVKGANGNELNPIQAFNVLQKRNQTLTALELKAQLRTVDIDANGEMALAEYLLFINKRDPIAFVTNPQGEIDKALVQKLEDQMNALNVQFEQLNQQLAAEQVAEENAKKAEEAAIEAKNKAQAAEDELRKIEEEARVIEAEIKAEEQKKADEIARLEALSQDQTVGIVKRNMAVQQLAQAKGEDPLPLRKAKLTQEAVVRRLTKATEAAKVEADAAKVKAEAAKVAREEASKTRKAAEAARAQAVAAREAADEAKRQADAAFALAQQRRAEAVAARELAEQKRAEAVAARKAAEQRRAEAVAAREAAEEAKKQTEAQIVECEAQLKETEQELDKLKNAGVPEGFLWYQSRILEDKKRSLPQRMW